jgi:hypothetical protein
MSKLYSEYDGRYNNDLQQDNWAFGSKTWKDQWPAGSSYPDYFVIGDLYTNVYEGSASLTDIRYYEPENTPGPSAKFSTYCPNSHDGPDGNLLYEYGNA